jgi:hypothetical protein
MEAYDDVRRPVGVVVIEAFEVNDPIKKSDRTNWPGRLSWFRARSFSPGSGMFGALP